MCGRYRAAVRRFRLSGCSHSEPLFRACGAAAEPSFTAESMCLRECPQTALNLRNTWAEWKHNWIFVDANEALRICLWVNTSAFNISAHKELSSRRSPACPREQICLWQSQLPHLFTINVGFTPSNHFPHNPTSVIHTTHTFTSAAPQADMFPC